MEPREGNSEHGIALTLKARSLVVDTSCGVLRGWRRGGSLLTGAVKERVQSEGTNGRNLGRGGKRATLPGYRKLAM